MTETGNLLEVEGNYQYTHQPDIKFGSPLVERNIWLPRDPKPSNYGPPPLGISATHIPASAMEHAHADLTVDKLLETFRLCKEREWMMEGELLPTRTLTRGSKTLFTPWIVVLEHDPTIGPGFDWLVKSITDDPLASATQVRFSGPHGLRMANEYAAWRMSMEPIMWQWAAPDESDTKHYTFTVGSIEWLVHVNNSDGVRPTIDIYAGNVLCTGLDHWPVAWLRPTPESDPQMAIESLLRYLS